MVSWDVDVCMNILVSNPAVEVETKAEWRVIVW